MNEVRKINVWMVTIVVAMVTEGANSSTTPHKMWDKQNIGLLVTLAAISEAAAVLIFYSQTSASSSSGQFLVLKNKISSQDDNAHIQKRLFVAVLACNFLG